MANGVALPSQTIPAGQGDTENYTYFEKCYKMVEPQSWNQVKNSLKIGTKLTVTVTKHFPFGIFVTLPGIEFTGIVSITDFNDEGIMTPSAYPSVGSSVDVVVLAFKETGQQIWLGMKPSQLEASGICLGGNPQ